jgi:hypothetical protein
VTDVDSFGDREIALEPLPPFADTNTYMRSVAGLPTPTAEQIKDFVTYVAGAKSWYKHLPARPPGAPMHFFLDPNAGRDRLRRWGHQVIYRDRTKATQKLHYSWMTTEDYRGRFGYLSFCCRSSTGIWTEEMLADGLATLDPNVSDPLVQGNAGALVMVPAALLEAGACMLTRTVHERTDATFLWKKWNQISSDHKPKSLRGQWPRIACLCDEMGRKASGKNFESLEKELNGLISMQRRDDQKAMEFVIQEMVNLIKRSGDGLGS